MNDGMSMEEIADAIPPGTRVAVISPDAKTFLGYGTYLGCVKPSPDDPKIAAIAEAAGFNALPEYQPLPCIRLDTGAEMWGFEIWWGSCEPFVDAGYTNLDIGASIRVHTTSDGVQVIDTLPSRRDRLDIQ
jgi:hypothetical protein